MMRISLRSLFLLMAICAVAVASLRRASEGWQTAIVSIAVVLFFLAVIVAVVERGSRRAAAAGCALSMAAYGLALLLSAPVGGTIAENREFNPSTGRLPTSRLLGRLYTRVADLGWVDVRTGKPADEASPSAAINSGDSVTTSTGEIPDRETFMVIGHAWWLLALGVAGGWLAKHVYLRQTRAEDR
jgi:hypothetical protein